MLNMSSPVPAMTNCDTQHAQHIFTAQNFTSVHTHMDFGYISTHMQHIQYVITAQIVYICVHARGFDTSLRTRNTYNQYALIVYTPIIHT